METQPHRHPSPFTLFPSPSPVVFRLSEDELLKANYTIEPGLFVELKVVSMLLIFQGCYSILNPMLVVAFMMSHRFPIFKNIERTMMPPQISKEVRQRIYELCGTKKPREILTILKLEDINIIERSIYQKGEQGS